MAPFTMKEGESRTLSVKRITEAVIIALLAAAATTWGTVQVLSVKMDLFEKRIDELAMRIERITVDFYAPRVPRGGER